MAVLQSPPTQPWAILAVIVILISIDAAQFTCFLAVVSCYWFILNHSTFPQELRLLSANLTMEQQATNLLAVVKNHNVPVDTKLKLLGDLKAYIKHHQVPEAAVSPSFEVVRASISTSQLLDVGFSTLSHLTKRLLLQDQHHHLATQAHKTYPCVLERLGDQKDRVRLRAIQAFADFWPASPADVEQVIRESALTSKSPRAKEAGMQWIVKVRTVCNASGLPD